MSELPHPRNRPTLPYSSTSFEKGPPVTTNRQAEKAKALASQAEPHQQLTHEAAREQVQLVLGVWEVLFTHCCDSKAGQLNTRPACSAGPKGSLWQPKILRSKVGTVDPCSISTETSIPQRLQGQQSSETATSRDGAQKAGGWKITMTRSSGRLLRSF